jgi:hypothetical protein
MPQVFVAHAAFAVTGIGGRASRGYDNRRNASVEELKGMV